MVFSKGVGRRTWVRVAAEGVLQKRVLLATELPEPSGSGHEGVGEEGSQGVFDSSLVGSLVFAQAALIKELADLGAVQGNGDAQEALLAACAMASDAEG